MDGARRVTQLLGKLPDLKLGGDGEVAPALAPIDHIAEANVALGQQERHFPPPVAVPPRAPAVAAGPVSLHCPLTGQMFAEPVVLLDDGITYERRGLEALLAAGDVSPVTGEPLRTKLIVPAWAIRSAVSQAREGSVELPTCSITLEAIAEPIVLADGCSYDAAGLEQWWGECIEQQRPMTSPRTNKPLPAHLWAPDVTLAWLIDELRMAPYPRHLAAVRGEAAALARPAAGPAPPDGSTPLMLASRHGRLEAVRLLLVREGRKELDARDERGGTALLYACSGGHREVVEQLLAAGADCDQPGFATKRTPLMVAAAGGFQAIAERLLASGARSDARCIDGHYAWRHARKGSLLAGRLQRLWFQDMLEHGVR